MTKKQFMKKYGLTEAQFLGKEKIGGSLDLNSLTSIPEGFNPTVGGSLHLESLTSIPEGFNPTVGGSLDLESLTSIPEGFNPTVGGSLYLESITSIPEGFNPTVGGSLHLESLTSIPEGFNPTVGGSLDLESLTSIPEGFNPTVGGSLSLNIPHNVKTKNPPSVMTWQNGKYIMVDGIFCEVVSKRKNIYRCKKVGSKDIFYVVVDGDKAAHGSTLKEAREDLLYKTLERDKSEYENLTINDTITHNEAVAMYRAITGACIFGIKDFIKNRLSKKKAKYTIKEIINITNGEYGHNRLVEFFGDN